MEPALTEENWREFFVNLSGLSDDSLATPLSQAIRNFLNNRSQATFQDADRFLHELRDWAVYTGGGSGFVMTLFNVLLGDARRYPPPIDAEVWFHQWTLVQPIGELEKVDVE